MPQIFNDIADLIPNAPADGYVASWDAAGRRTNWMQAPATAAEQAAATALALAQAVQVTVRTVSSPVPVAVMTLDYQVLSDDQRVAHDSPNDHVLTPLDPQTAANRRFVFSNGYLGGYLTLAGTFIYPLADGTCKLVNPRLMPGASVDVIARFVMDPSGTAPAPPDLRVDGGAPGSAALGVYVYDIVAVCVGAPDALTYAAFQEQTMSFQPQARNVTATKTTAYSAAVTDDLIPVDTTSATFAVTLPASGQAGNKIAVEWKAGTAAPTVAFASGASLSTEQSAAFPVVGTTLTFEWDGSTTYRIV